MHDVHAFRSPSAAEFRVGHFAAHRDSVHLHALLYRAAEFVLDFNYDTLVTAVDQANSRVPQHRD